MVNSSHVSFPQSAPHVSVSRAGLALVNWGNLAELQGTVRAVWSTDDGNISGLLSTPGLKDLSTTGDLASLMAVLQSEACG